MVSSGYDTGVEELSLDDPIFRFLYRELGYLPQRTREACFVSFVRTIAGQQLSGKAAQTIFRRLEQLCGGSITPQEICSIHPEKFLQAGLSRAKASYVKDIAKLFADSDITIAQLSTMSDHDLETALMKFRGIGPWSAKIIMLFDFGRLNAFPCGDATLNKIFCEISGKPLAELPKQVEKWSPHAGIVAMYMWSYADSQ